MPETKQPIPYEMLVRVQVVADRLAALGRDFEESAEKVDVWVGEKLGLVEGDELKDDDYSNAVAEEFIRCVQAREGALDA